MLGMLPSIATAICFFRASSICARRIMATSPTTSIPASIVEASTSVPRLSTTLLISLGIFLPLGGHVVVRSPVLLLPVELAPRLVHPGPPAVHVPPVGEAHL